MSLKERVYSVLVVSASSGFNDTIATLLPENTFDPVRYVANVSAGKRLLSEHSFDLVIINSPLPDDTGARFAIDICNASATVALLVVRGELYAEFNDKVREHGVFTLAKPTSKPFMENALAWMITARERLRKSEKKTLTIEEKMQEIRIVNKAKWVLISKQEMTEEDAHRYIEKKAMDRCVPKRVIAEEILAAHPIS